MKEIKITKEDILIMFFQFVMSGLAMFLVIQENLNGLEILKMLVPFGIVAIFFNYSLKDLDIYKK